MSGVHGSRVRAGAALTAVLLAAGLAAAPPGSAAPRAVPGFQGEPTRGTVVKVIDGDTVAVRSGNRTYRIQLYSVEAPNRGECYFGEARAGLRRLLPVGSTVTYRVARNPDELGRDLADGLTRKGVRIETALAARGLVEPFESVDLDEDLATAAGRAQSEGRGLYGACDTWPVTGPAPA